MSVLHAMMCALLMADVCDTDRLYEHIPGGAALVGDKTGWVLAEADPARALGRGLLWALRFPLDDLHILVDDEDAAGMLARRAAAFAKPPTVWCVEGTALAPADPTPLSAEPALDPRVEPLADVIRGAGAEPVVEHGALRGEVLGLEVAR